MNPIACILVCLVTSLYYFPVIFRFAPIANTKIILAAIGLAVFVFDMVFNRYRNYRYRDLFVLSMFALAVSLCSLLTVTFNNTGDYSYAGYIVSMWVWFAASYLVVRLMYNVHGYIDFRLIANYLIAVCVFQCLSAVLIDNVPAFKSFVDHNIETGQGLINSLVGIRRKYGIGALLDTAGVRFSAALLLIPILVYSMNPETRRKKLWLYLAAFLFIALEGNIISRTTLIGVVLGIFYCLLYYRTTKSIIAETSLWMRSTIIVGLVAAIIGGVYLYRTDPDFKSDIRFGFEGVFSLVEQGRWEVSSNSRLQKMYVFPESAKTWLIGDGYFSNPRDVDPYFIGKMTGGYYMETDVGYLRFIFYFGLLGLATFGLFFIKCADICCKYYRRYQAAFYLLVLLNFVIWLKVATDLFLVFSLFIAGGFFTDNDGKDEDSILYRRDV